MAGTAEGHNDLDLGEYLVVLALHLKLRKHLILTRRNSLKDKAGWVGVLLTFSQG